MQQPWGRGRCCRVLSLKLSSSPAPQSPLSGHSSLTDSLRLSLLEFPFKNDRVFHWLAALATYLNLSFLILHRKRAPLNRFPDSWKIYWMNLDRLRHIQAPSKHTPKVSLVQTPPSFSDSHSRGCIPPFPTLSSVRNSPSV